MLRFKCLSSEELTVLEQQFVKFLAAQSILAPDWVKIKETDPLQAQEIIEDFSNVVYGTVMSDALFLECKTRYTLYCYQCLNDRFVLVALEIDQASQIDLRHVDTGNISAIVASAKLQVYTTEKPYVKPKEDEVFAMMESGCEITDGGMFKVLGLML
ncbi:MAG: hypothetical protein DRI69_08145 [Bacteroidetes bacterium]|nr:MAG: hypothetical protein DRI69_08145 [Bacteroidota bacterium]